MSSKPEQNLELALNTFTKLANLSYRGELQPYLNSICDAVIEILGEGMAAVTLYRDDKKHILAIAPAEKQSQEAVDVHGQLSTYVVNRRQVLTVADTTTNSDYGQPPPGFHSYLGVPLILPNGEAVGSLCYFNRSVRQYTVEEQQVSSLFAERAAIALDNYELYHQLKQYSENLEQQVYERSHELLLAKEALANKEKLAAVGEFASRITHEVRNPLATIGLALDYLQKTDDPKSAKRAKLASNEVIRLEKLLNEVLLYAKPVQLQKSAIVLSQWLDDFLMTHESMLEEKRLSFQHQRQAYIVVHVDTDKLTQICLNLLRNACDASPMAGVIRWRTETTNKQAIISIHNGGDCIPPQKLPNITEPFVSAKAGGSGLGLAIVKSLVSAHQGQLHIESSDTKGTLVTLTLPLANL